jgi:hypothetical protein
MYSGKGSLYLFFVLNSHNFSLFSFTSDTNKFNINNKKRDALPDAEPHVDYD